jgi:endoglucanase
LTRERRRARKASALAPALLGVLWLAAACGGTGSSSPASSDSSSVSAPAAVSATQHFLSTYVADDGRVLRHDQGDDIVSEGQAYGMLVAELAGRDDTVRTIWSWTRSHLQGSDGLLAFHANADGKVIDHEPAADADTLAAYALLRYAGPDDSSLHADGKRLAAAVLEPETVVAAGHRVLVAGPWATRPPAVVNPSYWMPSVFDDLGRLTGDQAWTGMASAVVALTDQVTQGGRRLPPDWGHLDGGQVTATGQGGGGGTPQYGPDAQRVPLWFAYGCDDRSKELAGAWWSVLQQDDRSSASSLSVDGQTVDSSGSTLALLASAAAARAAGDEQAAEDLESGAAQTDQGQPSYYGGAWRALSEGLRSGDLGSCG